MGEKPIASYMDAEFIFELKRQLVHLLLGIGIALSVYYLKPAYGNLILIPLLLAIFFMLITPRILPELKVSNHLLFHFERTQDRMDFPFKGAIWYSAGIIPPLAFLPMDVACAIIAILSSGDSMSTLVGRFMGRHRIGSKSAEGFLGFFLFGFVAAAIFVPFQMAIIFAFLGAIIEFFAFMDDNFLVPVGLAISYLITTL